MPLNLCSTLKAGLRCRQTSHADSGESISLDEIQDACNWLSLQLDDASLSRTELFALAAALEPIRRQLYRVLKDRRARAGHVRATRLLEDALRKIDTCLYSVQPFRPYIWPAALRTKLRSALQSTTYALVAVRWADAQVTAAAS